jgi:hypothetical protein
VGASWRGLGAGLPWGAIALVACLGLAPGRCAFGCDSTSCSLLTRGRNGLLPKGTFRLDIAYGYTDMGQPLEGSREVDSVEVPRVDVEHGRIWPGFHQQFDGSQSLALVDAAYGLTPRLTLLGSLPVFTSHSELVAHVGILQTFTAAGNGDALVGVRYALGPPGLVGGLSIQLPTGPYKVGGEFGGGLLDPTMQPGTGAFGFVGSLQYSGQMGLLDLRWMAAASYQANTTNSFGYRFGNVLILTTGVNRPLVGRLAGSLTVKLYNQDAAYFIGQDVPSTGATFVYLTPGLQLSLPGGISLYGYLQLLPYRYVNDAQLAPSAGLVTGFSKTF